MHAAGAQKVSLRGQYNSLCAVTSKITPLVGWAGRPTATFCGRRRYQSLLLQPLKSRTMPPVAAEETISIQRAENVDHQLIRAIGVPGLTANIVNSTIGAGIFVLPALVAKGLGPAAPLAFVCCAIAMVLFVTCFAIAGSRVSLTGGLYAYVEVAFGRYVGFMAGMLYGITAISAVAGVGNVLVDSLGGLIPQLANPIIRIGLMFAVYLLLVLINVRGVRGGAGAVGVITLTKLLPIVLFVAVGLFFVDGAKLRWPAWPSSTD